ncbi:MAG: hypothetical protein US74_C0044G0014 [Parcubacteria group bacterium GW2011_GWA2_38_13]|nr:MAG: hypothetical protein US74_C0044G0014 [Parcubacteria group bacterium GW2011_GWA2_38_13]
MPSISNQNHGSSIPWLIYFFGSIGLFIFAIISFIVISKVLGVVALIAGIFFLSKAGFISLPFRRN